MAYSLTWLADVLRAAGCKVEEQEGWKERGRGDMGQVRGILCHHTASASRQNAPSLGIVTNGRPDLAGPLSQIVLGRDGTWFIVAAGRCNHAGAGSWQGVTAGNASLIGIEAENAGTGAEEWSETLIESYARGSAAILLHIRADDVMCAGHKEYALPKGRKIDPNFDMVVFREKVEAYMAVLAGESRAKKPYDVPAVPTLDPKRSMLRKGAQGNDVLLLQRALGVNDDGSFGPATDRAVKAFQTKHGLTADGLVGPATWEALEKR